MRIFKIIYILSFLSFCSSLYAFELSNYLKNREAQDFLAEKKYAKSDSLLSAIETEKFNDVVSYNKGIINLSKGDFTKAYKFFEHALKGNNISDDVIRYNMYKTVKDSGIAQLQNQKDGIKTLESSLLKMRDLYKTSKDSSIKVQSLHELYEISEILDQANKNKQQNKDQNQDNKENKDQEKKDDQKKDDDKKDQNQDKKDDKSDDKNDQDQNGNKKDDNLKTDEEKGHQILLDNVKEDRKDKVKDEIEALMNKNKEDKQW